MSAKLRPTATALAAAVLLAAAPAFATDYVQAPGSTLAFATAYEGEVFSGHFGRFTTTVSFDPQHPEAAELDVVIPLASASTANPDRDQTLLGPDFFSADKFPQARYSATGFPSAWRRHVCCRRHLDPARGQPSGDADVQMGRWSHSRADRKGDRAAARLQCRRRRLGGCVTDSECGGGEYEGQPAPGRVTVYPV
ncbi:hypothetical protein GCM10027191_08640 [Novilysobacter erysipheiresistens]